MNQVVGECLWSLHSASMSLQVVNRELMMSHLHRMTSYSRAQQMIDPAHPLILFIVQVCTCIIAHVHLCMLCMSMCAALCVLRCLCCAVCAALCVLRCLCCAVCAALLVLCCVCCAVCAALCVVLCIVLCVLCCAVCCAVCVVLCVLCYLCCAVCAALLVLCYLCCAVCVVLVVLRCVCCAACVVLFVLRCVCCAALHLFMTSLLMSVCRPCHGIHRKWSSWFILWTRGTCEQLVLLWVH